VSELFIASIALDKKTARLINDNRYIVRIFDSCIRWRTRLLDLFIEGWRYHLDVRKSVGDGRKKQCR